METLLGLCTKNEVIIAASRAAVRGVTVLKDSDDKTRQLSENCLLAFSGESGDTVQFAEYIQANTALFELRNTDIGQPRIKNLASFTRKTLADALRSRSPYQVNMLLGGYDDVDKKPSLYWIDYLASSVSVPYAAHGYASYYCLSTMDRHARDDLTLEEGLDIMARCAAELDKRLPINLKGLYVYVVGEDGVRKVD
ncbi:hypothetical protein CANCADRAFT_13934, partial [Tortispora caseinolytica NRRL Y-17796]